MAVATELVANTLSRYETVGEPVQVSLSNQLVSLLSDQLYQSPLKAIEELVVNAYDANATECHILVPSLGDSDGDFIIVYDNGIGMDRDGLTDLWQIGSSNKRQETMERRRERKQIGKFGIGKLATNTIANRLTYITKTKSDGRILSVTTNFTDFQTTTTGSPTPILLPVRVIDDWEQFVQSSYLRDASLRTGVDFASIGKDKPESWTIALLEDLKDKAKQMTPGRLRWVLSTAMPLQDDFQLFLNSEEVESSKDAYEKVAEFGVHEMPKERLDALRKSTGEDWRVEGDSVRSSSFPSGIKGHVIVTEKSLLGKSEDILRSHGFFIKVRNRLLNQGDPLFGLTPLIHGVFNRFRADIFADDLDKELKSSRETIEESRLKEMFRTLLRRCVNL